MLHQASSGPPAPAGEEGGRLLLFESVQLVATSLARKHVTMFIVF